MEAVPRKVLDAWYHPAIGMIVYLQDLDSDHVSLAVDPNIKTEMQARFFVSNPLYTVLPCDTYEGWGLN